MQQDYSYQTSPPSLLLAVSEIPRALLEAGSLRWSMPALMSAPKGDGHPVLVLPGFVTTDRSTRVLRGYLDRLGYDTHPWKLGRNLGTKAIGADAERLIARLEEVHSETGRKVSLVGWSLGGVMARIVAGRRRELVRQIVTLGSPISGSPKATNAWRAYKILTGQSVDSPDAARLLKERNAVPPVPSTAIFSRNDGIVKWQNCLEPEAQTTDNIEVRGSHCGLGVNPVVLYALADRLAQAEGDWKPFDRSTSFRRLAYPLSEIRH